MMVTSLATVGHRRCVDPSVSGGSRPLAGCAKAVSVLN